MFATDLALEVRVRRLDPASPRKPFCGLVCAALTQWLASKIHKQALQACKTSLKRVQAGLATLRNQKHAKTVICGLLGACNVLNADMHKRAGRIQPKTALQNN